MAFTYMVKGAPLPYCKGCGHGLVTKALGKALDTLQLKPAEVVIVTDIGCVGLAEVLFETPHLVHTTHGRSPAFAIGLALADSVLGAATMKPVVLIGDGGATIGISHLLNGALLNADVTVLVHNNFLFGMTGGQNSALSPLDFVTATTPDGNTVPPMDLARVLIACRAAFVARKLASDRDLADVIARAVAHPGFSVVEILELCTGFATKWNTLTGAQLEEVAAKAGYELGVLHEQVRPTFGQVFRSQSIDAATQRTRPPAAVPALPAAAATTSPVGEQRVVIAGTAGERVQTAAAMLARAAMRAGLQVTQKNDYPVTQGTGFSVSEMILSAGEILFTGVEEPSAVLVVSADGARELTRTGVFARVTAQTLVLADANVPIPGLPCPVHRFPFRSSLDPRLAALGAAAQWLQMTGFIPMDGLWTALRGRFGAHAEANVAALRQFVDGGTSGVA
jgi:2-oxoglutarate/2-oxoacid ferredoxin oxidoreductase subunit beta